MKRAWTEIQIKRAHTHTEVQPGTRGAIHRVKESQFNRRSCKIYRPPFTRVHVDRSTKKKNPLPSQSWKCIKTITNALNSHCNFQNASQHSHHNSPSPLAAFLFTDHIRKQCVGQFFFQYVCFGKKEADKCLQRTKLGELGEKLFYDGKKVGGTAVITNTAGKKQKSQCTSTIMCTEDERHAAAQLLRHWKSFCIEHKYERQRVQRCLATALQKTRSFLLSLLWHVLT